MPTLIATPGAANANAYLDAQAADAYFATRRGADAWGTLDAAGKDAVLIQATREVDRRDFRGRRASEDQALSWPRTSVRRDGVLLPSDSVPQLVQDATCEVALFVASDAGLIQDALQGMSEVRVGPIGVKLRDGTAKALPEPILRMLEPLERRMAHQFRRVRG